MHVCELGFQHMTGANSANSAMKQEGREDEGEGRGRSSECISHSIALQHTGTLLEGSDTLTLQSQGQVMLL
jgi:hypothetical protein